MSPAVRVKRAKAAEAPPKAPARVKRGPEGPVPAALMRAILAILKAMLKKDFSPAVTVTPQVASPAVTVTPASWKKIVFDCERKARGDGWTITAERVE